MALNARERSFSPEASERRVEPESLGAPSSVVLGFRFFALAAISGMAAFVPHDRMHPGLFFLGVAGAALTGVIQHATRGRTPARASNAFVWIHVLLWIFMAHAGGGLGSPLALGLLFELPLSGAAFGQLGVLTATVASIACVLGYALATSGPPTSRDVAVLVLVIAACAAITWRMIVMLERQRSRQQRSQVVLSRRAATLAEELRLLGDSLGDALLSIDDRGRVASLNSSGAALLGIDPREALGMCWQEVLHPDPDSTRRLVEIIDSGMAQRDVTMVLAPRPGSALTVRADIWRGSEREDRRVYLLLDARASSVADDPIRRLGESTACVAHQIRNSMHSIQGFVGRLGAPSGEQAAQPAADECLGALRGLGALAEDVLAIAGASRNGRERVAVQDVLHSALVLLGHPRIHATLPKSAVEVDVPRGPLVHAVFNLLDNALRVSPPEPTTDPESRPSCCERAARFLRAPVPDSD
ncbi:MAG: hypothetical protein E6K80_02970 [Candidatus Eisenbacteria bacterium]|uniref:PAS domain-containing protein n=1 Tax=Eiseniibacteriota bacterium TaxID=2212470 RepID=A0A538U924_UNCEI|nr:MAG: hypothetical protein E6K80_02970 [Candidatus Eisenbacteria bacterium]